MIEVFIEAGSRRVFASALVWPGWARSGKTEELAVAALADYLPRYAPLVKRAGLTPPAGSLAITVRHAGLAKNADFGSLGEVAPGDTRPLSTDEGARFAALLEAAWAALLRSLRPRPRNCARARVAAGAIPLRSSSTSSVPRRCTRARWACRKTCGPTRDLTPVPCCGGGSAAALRDPGGTVAPPRAWPLPTAARRIGWHVLDHLWEIEDKSEPG